MFYTQPLAYCSCLFHLNLTNKGLLLHPCLNFTKKFDRSPGVIKVLGLKSGSTTDGTLIEPVASNIWKEFAPTQEASKLTNFFKFIYYDYNMNICQIRF
jgi:hypothetical protein